MTTVEEIVVKFSGDATGLEKAGRSAQLAFDRASKDVARLNALLEKTKKNTPTYDAQAKALQSAVAKMAAAQDKLDRIREKSTPKTGADKGGGGVGIFGSFAAGAGIAAAQAAIEALGPALSKLGNDYLGLTKIVKDYAREQERSDQIQKQSLRLVADRGRAVDRTVNLQRDPLSGGADIERQIETRVKEQADLAKAMAQSEQAIKRLEAAEDKADTTLATIPVIGRGAAMDHERAVKNLDQEREKYRQLEQSVHDAGEQIKDLRALGSPFERFQRDRLPQEKESLRAQRDSIGLSSEQANLEKIRTEARRAINKTVTDEIQQQKELRKVMEDVEKTTKQIEDAKHLRRLTGIGRRGEEGEVIARAKEGRYGGLQDMLRKFDEVSAAEIADKFQTPFEKAGHEINRLNQLFQDGYISGEIYARALADVAKRTDDVGRAASRASTLSGSAEHFARMDEYRRTMEQPAADAANVKRAMQGRDAVNTTGLQKEGNQILAAIRDLIRGGKSVPAVKPANVEGS